MVVHIQAFGDSTQVGATASGVLQQEMDATYGIGAIVIEGRAVSGTDSQQLVDGTDGMNQAWPGSVTAPILLMNHGINDAYRSHTDAQYRANLVKLAAAPARVIFETPNPVHDVGYSTTANAASMRQVAATAGVAVADVQSYVLGILNWQVALPDGEHPDHSLQTRIAHDVTGPALAPYIKPLRCL